MGLGGEAAAQVSGSDVQVSGPELYKQYAKETAAGGRAMAPPAGETAPAVLGGKQPVNTVADVRAASMATEPPALDERSLFDRLDANNDGYVDRQEFLDAMTANAGARKVLLSVQCVRAPLLLGDWKGRLHI